MRPSRMAVAAGAAAAFLVASAPPAAAHGVGGRTDLPLPVWLFAWGAGFALLISFVVLGLVWPKPRLAQAAKGQALPTWTRRALTIAVVTIRLVGLVAFVVTLLAALIGDDDTGDNLAPVAVYVVFWVGMQLASAVFGGIWQVLSPFDTLAAIAQRVRLAVTGRPSEDSGLLPPPAREFTHWPAVAGIALFTWLELCFHEGAAPRTLAVALIAYSVAMLAGAARHGRGWLRTGDGFAAYFGLLAHLSPFTRDQHDTPRTRMPFAGLAEVRARPGTTALILVLLGSTTFDGLSRTTFWRDVAGTAVDWELTAYNTVGFVWTIAIVAMVWFGAMRLMASITEGDMADLARSFVHSLVPIALAYAVAHYFSLFVFEGQGAIALVSDPFGRGWDLFGTVDRRIDYRLVSTDTIAYVQAGAIIVGHVVGVVAAHDRAVELFPKRLATRSQYPLLAVMIAYTIGGLALLLGT